MLARLASIGFIAALNGILLSMPASARATPAPTLVSTPDDCYSGFKGLWIDGLHVFSCSGDLLALRPSVQIDGVWHTPLADHCTALGTLLTCDVGSYGTLYLNSADGIRLSFKAQQASTVQGFALRGDLQLNGASGWLSHGFQSWSQTGVIALQDPPSADAVQAAVLAAGEDEVYRRGREIAWWYTFVGGGTGSLLAGVSTAETFKSWLQVARDPTSSHLTLQLVNGAAGESLDVKAGESVNVETWQIYLSDVLKIAMDRYSGTLASRRQQKALPPLFGWNSWYGLWSEVSEAAVRANAAQLPNLASQLPQLRTPVVVIDDGWERAWGDWQTNDKFPSGLGVLAADLRAQGLATGVWLAPVMVAPNSPVALEHPDWLVQDLAYDHPTGTFKVLDVMNPAAAAHLQGVIRELVGAGIGLLKIDFLFGAALTGKHARPATGMQAYAEMMRLIREAAGPGTILIAVGAPPLATFPYVDGWRVGGDIAFTPGPFGIPAPQFSFIANQARSIAGRYPYCRATLCDADPVLMRSPLEQSEVEVGAWVVALAGGGLFLSDPLPALPDERKAWGMTAPTMRASLSSTPAIPTNFFPSTLPDDLVNVRDFFFTAEHAVPGAWRLPTGERLELNFTLWPQTIDGIIVAGHSAQLQP